MSVKKYLETTAVFTIDEFRSQYPTVTDNNLFARAVKSGKVLRVTRGLYVSNTGRYYETRHDKFLVASKLVPDATFAYHSALELLGVAHSVYNRVQYFSSVKRKGVEFQGNLFERYSCAGSMTQIVRAPAYGDVKVTTKEQTFIDCLSHIGRSGGAEETIRSLSAFPYMDIGIIKKHVGNLSESTVARIGWFFEQMQTAWNVHEDDLNYLSSLLSGNSYHFVSNSDADKGWSKHWRLILPAPVEEIEGWF